MKNGIIKLLPLNFSFFLCLSFILFLSLFTPFLLSLHLSLSFTHCLSLILSISHSLPFLTSSHSKPFLISSPFHSLPFFPTPSFPSFLSTSLLLPLPHSLRDLRNQNTSFISRFFSKGHLRRRSFSVPARKVFRPAIIMHGAHKGYN